jgi:hypothetical protein
VIPTPTLRTLAVLLLALPSLASAQARGYQSTGMATSSLTVSPSATNGNALRAVSATSTAPVVGGIATGGTDTTMTAWTAIAFAPIGTEVGSVSVSLKKGAGVADGGTIKGFLYTNGSSVPGSDISDTSTGQPTILYTNDLGTSYANFTFRIPKTGLTANAVYWFVLNASVSGGNIYVNSAANAGNYLATAGDSGGAPGAWTGAAKTGAVVVYGSSGRGVSAYSANHWAVYGESDAGFGVRGIAVRGPGGKFDSEDNYGVGGTSVNGNGVRGSSNNNIAISGVSVGSYGGQFQGTGGAQLVATSGAATAMQLVNLGSGPVLQALDPGAGYAVTSQIGSTGLSYFKAGTSLGCAALTETCGTVPEGSVRCVAGATSTPTKICVCTFTPTGSVYAWVNALKNSGGTGIGNTTTCP